MLALITHAYAWILNSFCAISSHLPLDKMAAISQTTVSSAFLKMKSFVFRFDFPTEVCYQVSDWQYVGIGSGNGFAPNRRQAIAWTNADPVHRRIYAALGRCVNVMSYDQLCEGVTNGFPHKGPVMGKAFQCYDVIMSHDQTRRLQFIWV